MVWNDGGRGSSLTWARCRPCPFMGVVTYRCLAFVGGGVLTWAVVSVRELVVVIVLVLVLVVVLVVVVAVVACWWYGVRKKGRGVQ